jgi:hypothetical protein
VRAYKSVDLPGFAHHVLALRLAGGVETDSIDALGAGGTSGTSLELLPGYAVGGSAETFGVRGFPADAQLGTAAAATTLEYRVPLFMPARGFKLVPLFFTRASLAAFAEAGSAWCPGLAREWNLFCEGAPDAPRWLAAAGAELHLEAALQYDTPYRFRLGVAAPVAGRGEARTAERVRAATAYFTLGLAF